MHGQILTTNLTLQKTILPSINYSTLKLTDLQTGSYSTQSRFNKFLMLGKMSAANRYPSASSTSFTTMSTSTSASVTGNVVKNVRYTISRTPITSQQNTTGTSTASNFNSGAIVCNSTPKTIFDHVSSLMLAGLQDPNIGVILPGKLFKVSDVVNGIFTPQLLPRKPGFIDINIQNATGPVSTSVNNFNDKTQVDNAINTLRNQTAKANVNTDFTHTSLEFGSASQFSLEYNVNVGANLAPLIEIPVNVSSASQFGLTAENSFNMAVVHVLQPMYTISIGGEGPQSTIQGTIPPDLLCVSDVIYGRMAFFYCVTTMSRLEAKVALDNLISVGLNEELSLAEAQTQLTANAKLLLNSSSVFARVIGGSTTSAVKVTTLAGLRDYIHELNPTVIGSNAYPISFNFRYADNNSQAFMSGVTSFTDKQCVRAQQVKIALTQITPTKVFDFGDEELFGNITVGAVGTKFDGNASFWSKSSDNWVTGKQGVAVAGVGSPYVVFNLPNPLPPSLSFTVNIKDKIMSDPETIGANETDKTRGYAQYSPTSFSVPISDIQNAGGLLVRDFKVAENNAEVTVRATITLITQAIQ